MSLYPVCYYNITLTNSPQILEKTKQLVDRLSLWQKYGN
jgi:hypothetical protein